MVEQSPSGLYSGDFYVLYYCAERLLQNIATRQAHATRCKLESGDLSCVLWRRCRPLGQSARHGAAVLLQEDIPLGVYIGLGTEDDTFNGIERMT